MSDYGIFKNNELLIVCGSKEKAEEMQHNYPSSSVFPVVYVDHKWEKRDI